jgi:kynureninase
MSQLRLHGYGEADMVLVDGDTESVLAALDTHGAAIALVLLPGVQYYLGTVFDIPRITAAARSKGCAVGWDLAHAVGNIELRLHDWYVWPPPPPPSRPPMPMPASGVVTIVTTQ